ncbi:hypothetical protein [Planococcus lenghuensis]|uniref:Uncharacterized protein n=1 Tax=Planococcus lenghuensis TaxID=2213202 RepID=A0A1Q2L0U5_9BACL|nr:hypothetical protein [Planococcus lenghuensis]AQQ53994.1 hypothetical protein B0X71_13410 [Planococcus lenghuensis]
MKIVAERDLIKDEYGNYYLATNVNGDNVTVVNAAVYYAFNRMLDEELLADARNLYPNEVAAGKFFADQVAKHIEQLEDEAVPGGIYDIEEVKEAYDLHVKPLYDESFHL